MSKRRSSGGGGIPRWQWAGLGALAVTVAGVTALALTPPPPPGSTPATVAISTTPTPTPTAAPAPGQAFAAQWALLAQADRPFTVAVIGDSTGNDWNEWVALTFRQIADDTGRPLTLHAWDAATHQYTRQYAHNEAARGAALTVWNGSAAGQNGDYSLEHLSTLVPQTPDVVILNHGHNSYTPSTATALDYTRILEQLGEPAGVAVALQNPRLDQHADAFDRAMGEVQRWADERGHLVLDLLATYRVAPDLSQLVNPADGVHPTPAGSELAAGVVVDTLARLAP